MRFLPHATSPRFRRALFSLALLVVVFAIGESCSRRTYEKEHQQHGAPPTVGADRNNEPAKAKPATFYTIGVDPEVYHVAGCKLLPQELSLALAQMIPEIEPCKVCKPLERKPLPETVQVPFGKYHFHVPGCKAMHLKEITPEEAKELVPCEMCKPK